MRRALQQRARQRQRVAAYGFFDEEAGVSDDGHGSPDEDGGMEEDDNLEGFIVATGEATPSAGSVGRPSVTPSSR